MNEPHARLALVQSRIAQAAARAGRTPESITLVGVAKTHPAAAVAELLRAGLAHVGENKVQEAAAKISELGRGHWHLIGHLQSNKARHAVQWFDSIDSVDSLDLGRALSRRALQAERRLRILLEINLAGEASKFGLRPELAAATGAALAELPQLRLAGLMAIPPFFREPEKARPFFAQLRGLRDEVERASGLALPVLSMGMSHDFEIAVEEGATEVRIGSALFGVRARALQSPPADGD